MPEHIIKFSKAKLAFYNAMVVVAICYLFFPSFSNQAEFNSVLAFVVAAVMLLSFRFFIRKLFDPRPGLILDDQGLTDHSTGTSIGFVPWSDITGIKRSGGKGQQLLSVIVSDPQKYWRKGGAFKRVSNWFAHKMFGSPVNISTAVLSAKPAKVLALIEEYRTGAALGPRVRRAPAEPRAMEPERRPAPVRVPVVASTPSSTKPNATPRDPRYDYSGMFDRSERY